MAYMWDERYASEEYVYGTEPNAFFKQQLDILKPGKLLLPAEGEGRNAAYAASLGWEVLAFDLSVEGQKKALKLAKANNVSFDYQVIGIEEIELQMNSFDAIGLCYVHTPPKKRTEYHKKLIQALKPGGSIILEGFSKSQINNNTGGPKNIQMLFSREELQQDFVSLINIEINELITHLSEGTFHQGKADIIRLFGKK